MILQRVSPHRLDSITSAIGIFFFLNLDIFAILYFYTNVKFYSVINEIFSYFTSNKRMYCPHEILRNHPDPLFPLLGVEFWYFLMNVCTLNFLNKRKIITLCNLNIIIWKNKNHKKTNPLNLFCQLKSLLTSYFIIVLWWYQNKRWIF